MKAGGHLFTKNNFIPIIRHVWSQTAILEKIMVIKWLVNIAFSLPSSSTTIVSRSKHDFGEWAIASHGSVHFSLQCLHVNGVGGNRVLFVDD